MSPPTGLHIEAISHPSQFLEPQWLLDLLCNDDDAGQIANFESYLEYATFFNEVSRTEYTPLIYWSIVMTLSIDCLVYLTSVGPIYMPVASVHISS